MCPKPNSHLTFLFGLSLVKITSPRIISSFRSWETHFEFKMLHLPWYVRIWYYLIFWCNLVLFWGWKTVVFINQVYAKAKECSEQLSVEDFSIVLAKHFTSFYSQVGVRQSNIKHFKHFRAKECSKIIVLNSLCHNFMWIVITLGRE